MHCRIQAHLSQMKGTNRFGLKAHCDRQLQKPFTAGLVKALPKARHLRRIDRERMLKILFPTEVLPIRILSPPIGLRSLHPITHGGVLPIATRRAIAGATRADPVLRTTTQTVLYTGPRVSARRSDRAHGKILQPLPEKIFFKGSWGGSRVHPNPPENE